MVAAIVVLVLLLVLFGGGGFVVSGASTVLWAILALCLIAWAVGFFARSADGGGRWYRW